MSSEVDVVERVLTLLQDGSFTTTYKHAVLLALMDLCLTNTTTHGLPPASVTTRQLAERVIELYWPQTAQWDDGDGARVLAQNSGVRTDGRGRAKILQRLQEFRAQALTVNKQGMSSVVRARATLPAAYVELVNDVEWTLIEMPLPKLQRVGRHHTGWLYDIAWNDSDNLPRKREITRYQRGKPSPFAHTEPTRTSSTSSSPTAAT